MSLLAVSSVSTASYEHRSDYSSQLHSKRERGEEKREEKEETKATTNDAEVRAGRESPIKLFSNLIPHASPGFLPRLPATTCRICRVPFLPEPPTAARQGAMHQAGQGRNSGRHSGMHAPPSMASRMHACMHARGGAWQRRSARP